MQRTIIVKVNRKHFAVLYGPALAAAALIPFNPIAGAAILTLLLGGARALGLLAFRNRASFSCAACGLCCALRVDPTEADARRLEKRLGVERSTFLEKSSLRRVGGRCLFLKSKKCSVYPFRPTICRQWPFHKNPVALKWFVLCPPLRNKGMVVPLKR